MMFKPQKALLALAVAAATLASGVQAAELSFAAATFSPDPFDQYSDSYTYLPNGQTGTMGMWQVSATNPSSSFLAFCIEPFVSLPGAPGTGVTSATYTSGPNTHGALVQELYDRHYADVLGTGGTPAPVATVMGFQLALWSLANAEAVGNWNLLISGQDAKDAANAMLASVITPDTVAQKYTLTQWTSAGNTNYQDVLQAAPVPEPETYVLMCAGLAMVGTIVRRRKASVAA